MRKNSRALSLLTFALSLLLMFSLASVSVFAETDTEAVTEIVTDPVTEPEETTEAAETTGATAETTGAVEESKGLGTQAIINLAVGGVLLVVLVILCIKFRNKIPEWFRSVKSECKKIVWCPKDQLKNSTIVVLITIIALAVVIGLLDFAFAKAIQLLRGLFQ